MKNIYLKYYIVAIYFCFTLVAFAQPGDNDTGGGLESPDAPAPIDDYVWLLALIALFFVFMKFRAMQNKKIQG